MSDDKCGTRIVPEHHCVDFSERYPVNEAGLLVGFRDYVLSAEHPSGAVVDDPPNLALIAGQHSITQLKFQSMVGAFFHPFPVPSPEVRLLAEMDQIIIDAANTGKIEFTYDELNKTTNDMDIEGQPLQAIPVYSAYLFRGIFQVTNEAVVKYHFYKAIDNGKFTVAIVALNATNNVLYLGELSELYP